MKKLLTKVLALLLIVSPLLAIHTYHVQANDEETNVCLLKDEEGNYLLSEEERLECLAQQVVPYGPLPDDPTPPKG